MFTRLSAICSTANTEKARKRFLGNVLQGYRLISQQP